MPRGMSRGRAKGAPSLSEEVRHNPGVPSTARQWATIVGPSVPAAAGWSFLVFVLANGFATGALVYRVL